MFYDFLHATAIFKQKVSVKYRISNEIQRKNEISWKKRVFDKFI